MVNGSAGLHRHRTGWLAALAAAALALPAQAGPLPLHLRDTGLYVEGTLQVRPDHLAFTPQYPLWSDGASKRRWIALPPGTFVDAARPDAWEFPVGTRLWKEFGYARPVETRYLERLADGSWRFASYAWNDAGTDAVLVPGSGLPRHPAAAAPGGRYDYPAEADCRACHEGGRSMVLGFSALQLSPDRDPLAPHGVALSPGDADLRSLAAAGLLRNLPRALLDTPPRIPAFSPVARAALGYLHGNCGHCHNDTDAAPPVALRLSQGGAAADLARSWESLTRELAQYRLPGHAAAPPVIPGRAQASALAARMRSRAPATQMPPLGTRLVDDEGLALVERWIDSLEPTQEPTP